MSQMNRMCEHKAFEFIFSSFEASVFVLGSELGLFIMPKGNCGWRLFNEQGLVAKSHIYKFAEDFLGRMLGEFRQRIKRKNTDNQWLRAGFVVLRFLQLIMSETLVSVFRFAKSPTTKPNLQPRSIIHTGKKGSEIQREQSKRSFWGTPSSSFVPWITRGDA